MNAKRLLMCVLCALITLTALAPNALGEDYPIYEVLYDALLRDNPGLYSGHGDPHDELLAGIQKGSLVLVAQEKDGWCLVYTQNELTGYMQSDYIKATGKTYSLDFKISADDISHEAADKIVYIVVEPQAVLPDADKTLQSYPATLTKGEIAYELEPLLTALLGEGYERTDEIGYFPTTKYVGRDPDKPYRNVRVFIETDELSYHDGMVTGERYGEYEPPKMNMIPDESLRLAKALLSGIVAPEWLEHTGISRRLSERWSYSERWMTDSEYARFMKQQDSHYFNFEHMTEYGVSILEDDILVSVGVNGLAMMRLNWHEFTASDAYIVPMPFDTAVSMANSTRYSNTVLLGAELVYSNWLTQSDEYNLSWLLITSNGSYVVDCVLNKHMCDHYEY